MTIIKLSVLKEFSNSEKKLKPIQFARKHLTDRTTFRNWLKKGPKNANQKPQPGTNRDSSIQSIESHISPSLLEPVQASISKMMNQFLWMIKPLKKE